MKVLVALLASALSCFAGCASSFNGGTGAALAPPRECEIIRGVWCILASDISFEHERADDPKFRSVWTFRGSYWADNPLIIFEPTGCRMGLSDEVEVKSVQSSFLWDKKEWQSFVVQLKKDGSCDLQILSPRNQDDPVAAAFSASLTEIRICVSSPCEGTVLAEHFSEDQRARIKGENTD